jgi:hypothetical protein
MSRRIAAWSVAGSMWLVVAACRGEHAAAPAAAHARVIDAAAAPAPAPREPATGPAEAMAGAPRGSAELELIDAGRAPRRRLRYRLAAGTTHRSTLRVGVRLTLHVAGGALPFDDLPQLELDRSITVDRVAPDGSADVTFAITGARFVAADGRPTPLTPALKEVLSIFNAVTGTATVTDRGIASDGRATSSEPDAETAGSTIEALTLMFSEVGALPAEPIGVGARWRVVSPDSAGALWAARGTSTVELESATDDRFVLRTVSDLTIDRQPFAFPGAQPGARLAGRATGTAGGVVVLRPDRAGAESSRLELSLDGAVESAQDSTTNMFSVDLDVTLEERRR